MLNLLFVLLLVSPPAESDSARVRFVFQPAELLLMVRDDSTCIRRIVRNEVLSFEAGPIRLRFIHPLHFDRVLDLSLAAGQDTTIRVSFRGAATGAYAGYSSWYVLRNGGRNLYVDTDDETEIWLDGTRIGTGHVWTTVPLDSVPRSITLVHKRYRERRETISFDVARSHHIKTYLLPDRRVTLGWSIVPGAAQFYEDDVLKGTVFAMLAAAGYMSARYHDARYLRKNAWYLDLRDQYRNAGEADAERLGDQTARIRSQAADLGLIRDLSYGLALTSWVLSAVDAVIPHPIGYRQVRVRPNPYALPDKGATVTVSF